MPNISHIVRKIKSVESTAKMTDSLKIVSSNKFIIYKDIQKKGRYYNAGIQKLFNEFYCAPEHYFLESNKKLIRYPAGPTLWVVIGSDIGMCGDFNNRVAAYTTSNISDKDKIIVLGLKLNNILKNKVGNQIVKNILSEVSPVKMPSHLVMLTKMILKEFINNKCGKLVIIYLKDKQRKLIERFNVLPFGPSYFLNKKNIYIRTADYRVKYPSIILDLFPKYLESLIMMALTNSKISEHTIRKDLMNTATKNVNELLDEYKILFNKTRQSIITQEISEIIATVQIKK